MKIGLNLIILALTLACSGPKSDPISNDKTLYSMGSESGSTNKSDDEMAFENKNEEEGLDDEELKSDEVKVADTISNIPADKSLEDLKGEKNVPVASTYADPDTADLSVYRVQEDKETLMLISFKIYGDYTRWKELVELNRDMFDERFIVKKGMMLKFKVPDSPFEWTAQGEPYLITKGDTLSRISKKVYDTFNRWKQIFENNRPLIRDPNKIFSGFTIYYSPLNKNAQALRKKENSEQNSVGL